MERKNRAEIPAGLPEMTAPLPDGGPCAAKKRRGGPETRGNRGIPIPARMPGRAARLGASRRTGRKHRWGAI
jgi:hypothetical protein